MPIKAKEAAVDANDWRSEKMTEETAVQPSGRKSVFISYAQQDRATAQLLALRLQDAGLDAWLDKELPPNDHWQNAVDSRLLKGDYFIVLISAASVNSKHFHDEVMRPDFIRGLSDRLIPIIPILLDDVKVPSPMRDVLYLDFRSDSRATLEKLVATLAPTIDINFSILSPSQFENLVADLLGHLGYAPEREAAFHGLRFDFRLPFTRPDPFGGVVAEDWLIEVKHHSASRLSVTVVREFAAVATAVRDQNVRIALVTSSQVTSAAREIISEVPIRLVEGVELKRLLLARPELLHKYFGHRLK